MTTYWKSQPRKMCEYCKCWITDNKPSVQFHERGKKHQENVKRKLDELRKKGLKDAKDKQDLDSDFAAMERAALEAFKKDVQNDPSLAKQYGVELDTSKPVVFKDISKETPEKDVDQGEWYEAHTSEGHTYYWNTVSGESKWDIPPQFVSLAEQQQQTDSTETSQEKDNVEETSGKSHRHSAFGQWQTVKDVAYPDLNLPTTHTIPEEKDTAHNIPQEKDTAHNIQEETRTLPEDTRPQDVPVCDIPLPLPPVESVPIEPKSAFKEKRVILTDAKDSGNVGFKKRKLNSGNRSLRQKTADN